MVAESSGVSQETFQQLDDDLKARPRAVHQGSFDNDWCTWGMELQLCFHAKAKNKRPGGQNMALQKRSPGIPAHEQLRIHRQDPGAEGGSSQHHPLLPPTACRMSLLQTQRGAQSCCIPCQTSPSFHGLPGVFSSQIPWELWLWTGRALGATGMDRACSGHSRTIPLTGKLSNKSALL